MKKERIVLYFKVLLFRIKNIFNKKVISLDFDGVLFNLDIVHKDWILKNHNIDYKTEDVTHWEYLYENYPGITDCWTKWELYSAAPFIHGAVDFVEELKKIYGADALQIVTSTPLSIQKEKTKMIKLIFGIDVIHVTKEQKSLFTKGTILIDDAIHNILDHLKNTSNFAILFDLDGKYGWNNGFYECSRTKICESHKEVLICIQNILKK